MFLPLLSSPWCCERIYAHAVNSCKARNYKHTVSYVIGLVLLIKQTSSHSEYTDSVIFGGCSCFHRPFDYVLFVMETMLTSCRTQLNNLEVWTDARIPLFLPALCFVSVSWSYRHVAVGLVSTATLFITCVLSLKGLHSLGDSQLFWLVRRSCDLFMILCHLWRIWRMRSDLLTIKQKKKALLGQMRHIKTYFTASVREKYWLQINKHSMVIIFM